MGGGGSRRALSWFTDKASKPYPSFSKDFLGFSKLFLGGFMEFQ
jgi:hypothetical protein